MLTTSYVSPGWFFHATRRARGHEFKLSVRSIFFPYHSGTDSSLSKSIFLTQSKWKTRTPHQRLLKKATEWQCMKEPEVGDINRVRILLVSNLRTNPMNRQNGLQQLVPKSWLETLWLPETSSLVVARSVPRARMHPRRRFV